MEFIKKQSFQEFVNLFVPQDDKVFSQKERGYDFYIDQESEFTFPKGSSITYNDLGITFPTAAQLQLKPEIYVKQNIKEIGDEICFVFDEVSDKSKTPITTGYLYRVQKYDSLLSRLVFVKVLEQKELYRENISEDFAF